MIREAIAKLAAKENLTLDEARRAMEEIMEGKATPGQIGAYLTALALKGETVDEVTGSAMVMREKVVRVDAGPGHVIDTCGTGGDRFGTFNISTATALVLAGCGLTVAKHGNRAASSRSGSADVLKELGVNIDADFPVIERCMREAKIGFLFAVRHHASMKYAVDVRREIGIRTIFNILGPLTNPAGAQHQLLGVFSPKLTEFMANVLKNLGSVHACVVHGSDGMDEITTCAETTVAEIVHGAVRTFTVKPEDYDLPRAKVEDLQVDGPARSAVVIRDVLANMPGPARDIVLLNAAFGLVAADMVATPRQGLEVARQALAAGFAKRALDRLVAVSNATA